MDLVNVESGSVDFACLIPDAGTNKYSRGKLTIVGGSDDFPGATCLAADASVRAGAGYIEVVCHPEGVACVRMFRPSVVVRAWDGWRPALSALDAADARKPRACLIGPGMYFDDFQAWLVESTVDSVCVPCVIDGGALSILSQLISVGKLDGLPAAGRFVLTPHCGEAARIARALGVAVPDNPADEPALAAFCAALARTLGAVVVLKGPDTYIYDAHASKTSALKPSAACAITQSGAPFAYKISEGTAVLAKAGTGDILAGIIAAILAQGLPALDAALMGAALHARAGVCAQQKFGIVSAAPEDVLNAIPETLLKLIGE